MNETLDTTLRKLRLSGLAQSLDVRLHEAQSHQLSHGEFLELILQDELAVRADRQIERRTRAAMFRDQRTLEDFDFGFNTSIKRKAVYDLPVARSCARVGTCCCSDRRAWARAISCRQSASV